MQFIWHHNYSDLIWGARPQHSENTKNLEMLFESEVNSVLFPSALRPKSGLKVIKGFTWLEIINQRDLCGLKGQSWCDPSFTWCPFVCSAYVNYKKQV